MDDEIPAHGDSDASFSHEASLESTFKRREDFFWRKKDKISASTTANHWCRSAPRTSLNKGTSPSAPGGTRPRRDNAKEFATTHPNMERHLRDHAAAAFPLSMSGTSRTFAETRPRKNWFASKKPPLPLRLRRPRGVHVPRFQPTLGICAPSFLVLPQEQHHHRVLHGAWRSHPP